MTKRQPPMEEIKATRDHKVGIRPFNDDSSSDLECQQVHIKNDAQSGFYFFQFSGVPSEMAPAQASVH